MHSVLASTLPDKSVISADGRRLGTVYNLTMNLKTGKLEALIVKSNRSADDFAQVERIEKGHLRVPASLITGIDDQVVVDFAEAKGKTIP